MIENYSNDLQDEEKDIDIVELFHKYWKHWKWFLLSFAVCVSCAAVYGLMASPEYEVAAKVLIKEDDGKSSIDMLSAFSDLGFNVGGKNLENEIEVLKSRSLMQLVSDSLNLRVNYFLDDKLRKTDLYKKAPVTARFSGFHLTRTIPFTVDYDKAKNILRVSNEELSMDVESQWNEPIVTPYGTLVIAKNINGEQIFPVTVTILGELYTRSIEITPTSKYASVLELSLRDANPQKAEDIINTLVFFYNRETIIDKNITAQSTIDFINTRLEIISGELGGVEKEVEDYKKVHRLTDIGADANVYLSANSEYEKKISEVNLQLSILTSIRAYLEDDRNKDNVVPSNLGINDPTLVSLVENFNQALLDKARITKGMKPGNPILKNYEEEAAMIRRTLIENIKNVESGVKLTKTELAKQGNKYSSKITGLSTQEREFRELYRQQNIKETLFLYLLQKKEETGLYLTAVAPSAKIIDATHVTPQPVKPRKGVIIFIACVISILIPIILIYLKGLINYKIVTKDELMKLSNVPFLGEIPKDKISLLTSNESGSILAEKFRISCVNLDFMLTRKKGNRILVTSTLSGEGKTFYSTNLAVSLANIGAKVLLINLDIHKSDISTLFKVDSKQGITTFLADKTENVDDIIFKAPDYDSLDIIPAGPIPPNPGSLLMSVRLGFLFDQIEDRYDYIVIDTPPIGLLADALMIAKYADATAYIVKLNYTPKSAFSNINNVFQAKKLPNMSIVLNESELKDNFGKYYNKYYKKRVGL